eukprot:scaffold40909_cov73-Phaeocystis_antarctica.AAC.4
MLGSRAGALHLGEARVGEEGVTIVVKQDVLGLEVAVHDGALAATRHRGVKVEQRLGRLPKDAKALAPLQRAQRRREAEAPQVLRVGLGRPQPVSKAATAHQREDEARRPELETVAEQRSARLCAPDLARLTATGKWRTCGGSASGGSEGSASAENTWP